MTLDELFATQPDAPRTLHCVGAEAMPAWREALPANTTAWLDANGSAAPGTPMLLPMPGGSDALLITTDAADPYAYAALPWALPPGDWRVSGEWDDAASRALQLGWGLGGYRFDRYKKAARAPARLVLPTPDPETRDVLAACWRVRDLVNTPTEDMGPDELEAITRTIAATHGAQVGVVRGDALAQGYPAVHAVGRASHRAPRLIELTWGASDAPHLVLVGKGVCFDTGGLNMKASAGMRNMKKDMGGAAHAIALAELLMARALPIRLTLLVPAVENAVGPDALRPGEVIATRKGLRVEIDNTDAEGRLILGDALARACELQPRLLLDFATLTGAARVALGPDLPALYANDDALAEDWLAAGLAEHDPLWRMPLWQPYLRYLTSPIADLANASGSTMAGSVTAALFLQKFVEPGVPWAHLDVFSWNEGERPGRPAGGEAQGLRAVFAMLKPWARFSA